MGGEGRRVRDLQPAELTSCLRRTGIDVDYGAAVVRVKVGLGHFAEAFRVLYGGFVVRQGPGFADFHVSIARPRTLRAFFLRQSVFEIDGVKPFDPFPFENAIPLFEWGVNWCVAQRFNQYVLLHAGSLARQGQGVILAAPPGSGKSTLSAAMMLRGYRLLSDEFGVLCPETGEIRGMLKPVALKNQSIEVIRNYSKTAVLGPVFAGTRKGDVAHLAPNDSSVDAVHASARPALVIFPRYDKAATLELKSLPREHAFAQLAFNSFNYPLLGPIGFKAVADVIESAAAYSLTYGDLDGAIDVIDELLDDTGVVA